MLPRRDERRTGVTAIRNDRSSLDPVPNKANNYETLGEKRLQRHALHRLPPVSEREDTHYIASRRFRVELEIIVMVIFEDQQ